MGEGIHILNKTAITRFPMWCLWVILICMIFLVISAVLVFCNKFAITGPILVLIVIFIVITICIGASNEVETGRYKYEVIIDETVSFDDIYENYKVIEQCGEIWVLEDKE